MSVWNLRVDKGNYFCWWPGDKWSQSISRHLAVLVYQYHRKPWVFFFSFFYRKPWRFIMSAWLSLVVLLLVITTTCGATSNDNQSCLHWWLNWHHENSRLLVTCTVINQYHSLNSSPPGQNGRHLADDIFRWIFVKENFCILIRISLNFVPECPIDNNPTLV